MTDHVDLRQTTGSAAASIEAGRPSLLGRFATQFTQGAVPFEIVLPDGSVQHFGMLRAGLIPGRSPSGSRPYARNPQRRRARFHHLAGQRPLERDREAGGRVYSPPLGEPCGVAAFVLWSIGGQEPVRVLPRGCVEPH